MKLTNILGGLGLVAAGLLLGVQISRTILVEKSDSLPEPPARKVSAQPQEPRPGDHSKYHIGRSEGPSGLYLDLMKHSLTDLIYEDSAVVRRRREEGKDRGGRAYTMIGMERMDNLHQLADDVLTRGVPGDFIEAGAWRGGATIFMRAVLKARGITDRMVWVADSFEGLPEPDLEQYPADDGMDFSKIDHFAVSVEQVKRNFDRYGLLDEQVRFLKGWFKDSLPEAPIEKLAILRVDADLYESTMDALVHLYPKVSPGGYVIVDDYGCFEACAKSVHDFVDKYGIDAEIKIIDWTGVYWQKPTDEAPGEPK